MTSKKINNFNNPTEQFFTPKGAESKTEQSKAEPKKKTVRKTESKAEQTSSEPKQTDSTPKKRGRKPSKTETKTQRMNLLLKPSVCEDIQKVAYMKRNSVNGLISDILTEYIEENSDLLEKYKEIFGDE